MSLHVAASAVPGWLRLGGKRGRTLFRVDTAAAWSCCARLAATLKKGCRVAASTELLKSVADCLTARQRGCRFSTTAYLPFSPQVRDSLPVPHYPSARPSPPSPKGHFWLGLGVPRSTVFVRLLSSHSAVTAAALEPGPRQDLANVTPPLALERCRFWTSWLATAGEIAAQLYRCNVLPPSRSWR